MSCTGAIASDAATAVAEVIAGVAAPASPNAARPAPTTATEAAMKTARRKATSDEHLLRLATAGSVDDGKSTLVGRLLFDSKAILADQLDAVESVSRAKGLGHIDLALLTTTACAPNASRASRSMSRTAISPPRTVPSSWPTAPGTCSTPATR